MSPLETYFNRQVVPNVCHKAAIARYKFESVPARTFPKRLKNQIFLLLKYVLGVSLSRELNLPP